MDDSQKERIEFLRDRLEDTQIVCDTILNGLADTTFLSGALAQLNYALELSAVSKDLNMMIIGEEYIRYAQIVVENSMLPGQPMGLLIAMSKGENFSG